MPYTNRHFFFKGGGGILSTSAHREMRFSPPISLDQPSECSFIVGFEIMFYLGCYILDVFICLCTLPWAPIYWEERWITLPNQSKQLGDPPEQRGLQQEEGNS